MISLQSCSWSVRDREWTWTLSSVRSGHNKLRKLVAWISSEWQKPFPKFLHQLPGPLTSHFENQNAAKTWTCHKNPSEIGCTQAYTSEDAILAWQHSPLLLRFLLMSRVPAELSPSSGTSARSAVCRDRKSKWDGISQKKWVMRWKKTTQEPLGNALVGCYQSRASQANGIAENTVSGDAWQISTSQGAVKAQKELQTKFTVWSTKDFFSIKWSES